MSESAARYHEALQAIVDGVETELRRKGLWEGQRPPASALESSQPFCFDSMHFVQWLQWIFIPRLKLVLDGDEPLPESSRIEPYAEECLGTLGADGDQLLFLVRSFDELIAMRPDAPSAD